MRTPAKEHTRSERLRQHAAVVEQAHRVVGAMGLLVRGREARPRAGDAPLEIEFAGLEVDGRALPAAVWVALRRNDVDAAIETMTAVSQTQFVIEEREEMGEGYRLQHVQDSIPVPEPELLTAQLSQALDVPLDVLTVIAEWGADDPRATSEIDELLSSRFGPPDRGDGLATGSAARLPELAEASGRLTMAVADVAQVLRLDDDQTRALATLVRNATVTLTA
jgi:hypothetical protein